MNDPVNFVDPEGESAKRPGQVMQDPAGGSGGRGRGLNPFKGKTASQIDQMFRKKGFETRGPSPVTGKGGYVNPRTGRSYHIDPANRFGERPHVDVNRSGQCDLPKRKFPMGD